MSTISEAKTRAQYLQMLGIVQYLPRELEDPQQPDGSEQLGKAVSTEGKAVATVTQVTSQAAEIADKLLNNQSEVTTENAGEQEAAPSQSRSEAVEWSLALWQPADDLLICTAVDGDLPDQQQVSLLANIVKAMGQKIATLPQFELISWPPHRNMQGGELEAREYLSTLIKARADSRSTKTLLLLGKSAGDWLLSAEQLSDVDQGLLPVTGNLTALRIPSLQEMFADQAFKREAWEIIRRYLKSTGAG